MREILFKAKRIDNGEWVEGSLLIDKADNCYIGMFVIPKESEIVMGGRSNGKTFRRFNAIGFVQVDKTTICQYTGLTDMNGNKIWENDIVKLNYTDHIVDIGWIKYSNARAMYRFIVGKESYSFGLSNEMEVIGNIFDNPKLLKGGAE